MITFGSLFAGIGGLDLGLERAGMQCAWQVEIDDYATRVLAKHWPSVPKFRDVCSVGAHNLPKVDLICGGFPCQDISNAGQRAGITGNRSGLWTEFARLICELRPRYVLVENVAALLGRGLSTILGDLAALRYDAEWQCIPAAAVGAPHRRDRVFIVAYTRCTRRRKDTDSAHGHESTHEGRPAQHNYKPDCYGESDRARRISAPLAYTEEQPERARLCADESPELGRRRSNDSGCADVAHTDGARSQERQSIFKNTQQQLTTFERSCSTGSGIWATEPGMGRVADGVSNRVDRLRGLGNAVVPQVAEFIGRQIVAFDEGATDHDR